ncbi:Tetratricopeptide repeat-containing protein [Piscirickettsia salmonis]|nr:Tetratricopeptide repeat-containing protein [Piscirickettsia salmonis]QGP57927.1 Tetratricopeptide repeat-containing protein [Piscirickettsia salmonis]QGP65765.1 Tetratricopeptide repeat-containing protein [Piscirickettsia salmonis]
MVKPFQLFAVIIITLGLSGCATTSVFKPYPSTAKTVKNALVRQNYQAAEKYLLPDTTSEDGLIYLLELGRTQQLAGQYQQSLKTYQKAIGIIDKNQQKPIVQLSKLSVTGLSLLTNDNAIPFTTSGYEQVMVHHYQALNYFALGNLTGALVEVRRADEVQRQALERHQQELDEANNVAAKQHYDDSQIWGNKKFNAFTAVAGKVQNSFQNAYTFYFSGLLYEISGSLNDAYIDYKKALKLVPNNPYVQADVLRLAKQLNMTNDLAGYRNYLTHKVITAAANQGTLVVLFEAGFVPAKQQFRLPLPTGAGLIAIAIPYYNTPWQSPHSLEMTQKNNEVIGKTSALVSMQALAAKALQERMPWIIAREIARSIAKAAMTYQLQKEGNGIAALISSVYNVVSAQADLRSWLTLPDQAQVLQKVLSTGRQELTLNYQGLVRKVVVNIKPRQMAVVWVVALGHSLNVHVLSKS